MPWRIFSIVLFFEEQIFKKAGGAHAWPAFAKKSCGAFAMNTVIQRLKELSKNVLKVKKCLSLQYR